MHNYVAFLFSYFSVEFQLDTAQNGYLAAVWTVSILICGPKANTLGQVQVMVPGLFLGAVALVALALSQNVAMLYLFTAVAGFGCGSIVSSSLSFLAEQSDQKNRGLFYGTAQSSFTLIGSAAGSLVFTRLAASSAGWRGCYLLMAGLIFFAAVLIFTLGHNIPRRADVTAQTKERQSFRKLFVYKNVILSTVLACLARWQF